MVVSIGAAYLVMHAHGIMDYVQALFSIFIAPLLGTILLGMFWKRATALAGFWACCLASLLGSLFMWVKLDSFRTGQRGTLTGCEADGGEHVPRPVVVHTHGDHRERGGSMLTKPRPVEELEGLVYGATSSAD